MSPAAYKPVAPPPPAPWRTVATAVIWVQRVPRDAVRSLPEPLAERPWLPLGLGGLVFYREGPVGPYSELFAAPLMLRAGGVAGHVPFMAVDSAASVAGGRVNWALPKELATFEPVAGRPGCVTVRGDGWAVRVTAAARARSLPIACSAACAQIWADGAVREFLTRLHGRARLASVDVEALSVATAPAWLAAGRRAAVTFSGAMDVMAPG
jgi:hypothetical protein